jgi:hypothetical protein
MQSHQHHSSLNLKSRCQEIDAEIDAVVKNLFDAVGVSRDRLDNILLNVKTETRDDQKRYFAVAFVALLDIMRKVRMLPPAERLFYKTKLSRIGETFNACIDEGLSESDVLMKLTETAKKCDTNNAETVDLSEKEADLLRAVMLRTHFKKNPTSTLAHAIDQIEKKSMLASAVPDEDKTAESFSTHPALQQFVANLFVSETETSHIATLRNALIDMLIKWDAHVANRASALTLKLSACKQAEPAIVKDFSGPKIFRLDAKALNKFIKSLLDKTDVSNQLTELFVNFLVEQRKIVRRVAPSSSSSSQVSGAQAASSARSSCAINLTGYQADVSKALNSLLKTDISDWFELDEKAVKKHILIALSDMRFAHLEKRFNEMCHKLQAMKQTLETIKSASNPQFFVCGLNAQIANFKEFLQKKISNAAKHVEEKTQTTKQVPEKQVSTSSKLSYAAALSSSARSSVLLQAAHTKKHQPWDESSSAKSIVFSTTTSSSSAAKPAGFTVVYAPRRRLAVAVAESSLESKDELATVSTIAIPETLFGLNPIKKPSLCEGPDNAYLNVFKEGNIQAEQSLFLRMPF